MADAQQTDQQQEVVQLLNAHRNMLLGVQILLAGLLGVPFTAAFAEVTGPPRTAYIVAVLAAAGASAFLIAPSQVHRRHAGSGRHEATLRLGRACGAAGIALLGVAVVAVVGMILHVVVGPAAAVIAAATMAALLTALWLVLPLAARST